MRAQVSARLQRTGAIVYDVAENTGPTTVVATRLPRAEAEYVAELARQHDMRPGDLLRDAVRHYVLDLTTGEVSERATGATTADPAAELFARLRTELANTS